MKRLVYVALILLAAARAHGEEAVMADSVVGVEPNPIDVELPAETTSTAAAAPDSAAVEPPSPVQAEGLPAVDTVPRATVDSASALPTVDSMPLAEAPVDTLAAPLGDSLPVASASAPVVAEVDSIPGLAILAFGTEGNLSEDDGRIFSDSLIALLAGMGRYRPLPAARRDSLLDGWDPGECRTESCRQEAASRLGVPYLLAGRLTRNGDKWLLVAHRVALDSTSPARTQTLQAAGIAAPVKARLAYSLSARLSGLERTPPEFFSDEIVPADRGPTWARVTALLLAGALAGLGVFLSW